MRRVHENVPSHFPSSREADFEIIKYNVGIRPARDTGVRVEKEVVDGEKIVHAYGTGGGGYVFSFGIAREVSKLVDCFFFTPPKSKL